MVRNFQEVFEKLIKFMGYWIVPSVKALILIFTLLLAASLILYLLDKNAFEKALKKAGLHGKTLLAWILVVGFIFLQINLLTALRGGVTGRISQENSARYTTSFEPNGGETVQYAPSLSYMETTSRTQKLIIPKYTLNFIQEKGINELPDWSPTRLKYDTRPIVSIDDELEKDENTVVVKRKIVLNRFLPLKIDSNRIALGLKFKDKKSGLRKQFYQADFKGSYTFRNPFPDKKLIHFNFPLPANSGTLSDFTFKINGTEVSADNLAGGYIWEGEVDPGKTVTADIAYSHQGAQSWTYYLAGRREAISDFTLTVDTDNPNVKFLKGVLFPTKTEKGLGRTTLVWELKNLITSQNVSLFFSGTSVSEQITRLFIFAPVALLGFFLLILAFGSLKGLQPEIWRIALSTLTYSAGFALSSYLITPLSLGPALLISFVASGVLCHMILGAEYMHLSLILNLSPLAFIFPGNTGIILSLLGIGVIVLMVLEKNKNRTEETPEETPEKSDQPVL